MMLFACDNSDLYGILGSRLQGLGYGTIDLFLPLCFALLSQQLEETNWALFVCLYLIVPHRSVL